MLDIQEFYNSLDSIRRRLRAGFDTGSKLITNKSNNSGLRTERRRMQKPKPQAEVIKAKEPARLAGKTGPNHQTRLRGLEASQASESRCDLCAVFAAAFKRWRLKNNLQLKEIAADLGVSVPTVCTWETGKRFPTGRHFEMLIDYTGLPPCRLFCVMSDKCVPAECLLALPKQSAQAVG